MCSIQCWETPCCCNKRLQGNWRKRTFLLLTQENKSQQDAICKEHFNTPKGYDVSFVCFFLKGSFCKMWSLKMLPFLPEISHQTEIRVPKHPPAFANKIKAGWSSRKDNAGDTLFWKPLCDLGWLSKTQIPKIGITFHHKNQPASSTLLKHICTSSRETHHYLISTVPMQISWQKKKPLGTAIAWSILLPALCPRQGSGLYSYLLYRVVS